MVFSFGSFLFYNRTICFAVCFSLLREFEGTGIGPDGVDTHGSPGFFVDVVKGDCGALVESLLFGGALALGGVVGRDEVGAGGTACVAGCAVFLNKLKEDDTLVEGLT